MASKEYKLQQCPRTIKVNLAPRLLPSTVDDEERAVSSSAAVEEVEESESLVAEIEARWERAGRCRAKPETTSTGRCDADSRITMKQKYDTQNKGKKSSRTVPLPSRGHPSKRASRRPQFVHRTRLDDLPLHHDE